MKLSKVNQAHLLAALDAYQEATVLQGCAWGDYKAADALLAADAEAEVATQWEGTREAAWNKYQEALTVAAGLMMKLRFDIKGW